MSQSSDVIVAGLGAHGSATAYHLARRGLKIAGFDRFLPPHALGSSHGETRVIREAYWEDPVYVPVVQRAYELWSDLERESGEELFVRTGGIYIGALAGEELQGVLRSGRTDKLAHEVLSGEVAQRRFRPLRIPEGMSAIFEPRAGVLFPEKCIGAHLRLAAQQGAQIHPDEAVETWSPDGRGITIQTKKGTYRAGNLVLSTGAWLDRLVPELKLPLTVERNVLVWFEPLSDIPALQPDCFPVFLLEPAPGLSYSGFPYMGGAIKAAQHHGGEPTNPDALRRTVSEAEVENVRRVLRRFLPAAAGKMVRTAVCHYTNTPDHHFLIDFHPQHNQVVIGSPCSGHGFKFSPAIGEVLADLATEGRSRFDLSRFGLARLMQKVD